MVDEVNDFESLKDPGEEANLMHLPRRRRHDDLDPVGDPLLDQQFQEPAVRLYHQNDLDQGEQNMERQDPPENDIPYRPGQQMHERHQEPRRNPEDQPPLRLSHYIMPGIILVLLTVLVAVIAFSFSLYKDHEDLYKEHNINDDLNKCQNNIALLEQASTQNRNELSAERRKLILCTSKLADQNIKLKNCETKYWEHEVSCTESKVRLNVKDSQEKKDMAEQKDFNIKLQNQKFVEGALKQQVDDCEKRNTELKNENAELKKENKRLETRVMQLLSASGGK